jgi:hypothetical protein
MTATRPFHRRGIVRRSALLSTAMLAMSIGIAGPSHADATAVSGSATGFRSSVSLFGGPATERGSAGTPGCDLTKPAPGPNSNQTEGCSPTVVLPSTGSASPMTATDADGVRAVYGPAVVFGGRWPYDDTLGPPSGPITVNTQGTTGPKGSATSSVSISRTPAGSTWLPPGYKSSESWPGGIGPGPLIADGVSSTCTASEIDPRTGAATVSGSTTITNGLLGLTTNQDGFALLVEPMPMHPRPNDGPHHGVLTSVGDSYDVFYNEQDVSVPGSITVTAIHMKLLGPIAVGDLYIGISRCGVTTSPTGATICTALHTTELQLAAAIDSARAAIQNAPPQQQAALLATVDAMQAQLAAVIARLRAAACPLPAT